MPASDPQRAVEAIYRIESPRLVAGLVRLVLAVGGGWLMLQWSGNLSAVFLALGAALAAYGMIIAAAVKAGAWFRAPRAEQRSKACSSDTQRRR